MEILIFGAGSIGAHHAFASRHLGYNVTIYDTDKEAIQRFKNELYPNRYKQFDDNIQLLHSLNDIHDKKYFWIIGTPPDTHASILDYSLKYNPIGLLIEKPLCGPNDNNFKIAIQKSIDRNIPHYVGYNLLLSESIEFATKSIHNFNLKDPIYLSVNINESWNGILKAHPWLNGSKDSYLGFSKRGGGALFEHSHGVSLGVFFLNFLENSKKQILLTNVESYFEETFDSLSQINLCKNNLICNITQDVISEPTRKEVRIQFKNGLLILNFNYEDNNDLLTIYKDNKIVLNKSFLKNRADDFIVELEKIFDNMLTRNNSIILNNNIHHGLEVNKILDQCNITDKI